MTASDLTAADVTAPHPGVELAGEAELDAECAAFLYREAALLDDRRFEDWLECLTEDLAYLVPVRLTKGLEDRSDDFSDVAYHMRDSLPTLRMRVSRLRTEHAYGEDPPSRTVRSISNVHVTGRRGADVDVRSSLLLYRAQGGTGQFDLLAGTRLDVLRRTDAGWKLARRTVRLAHTSLPTAIGVFL